MCIRDRNRLLNACSSIWRYLHPTSSDHCAVVMSVRVLKVPTHGPGVWKLNLSVLNYSAYSYAAPFSHLAKRWDKGKSIIKGISIRFGWDSSSRRSQHRSLLSRLANHLKCRFDAGSISSCLGPYSSTLAEIARIAIEVARGAQVRACAHWVNAWETSSAFFLRLEKKQAADRFVAALRADDGSIVPHTDGLCHAFLSPCASLLLLKLPISL